MASNKLAHAFSPVGAALILQQAQDEGSASLIFLILSAALILRQAQDEGSASLIFLILSLSKDEENHVLPHRRRGLQGVRGPRGFDLLDRIGAG
jgi:hypothetical protein